MLCLTSSRNSWLRALGREGTHTIGKKVCYGGERVCMSSQTVKMPGSVSLPTNSMWKWISQQQQVETTNDDGGVSAEDANDVQEDEDVQECEQDENVPQGVQDEDVPEGE